MRIIWIPDTQVKPGVRTDHIEWCANYVREKRFDAVVIGGDWWDFPSLSSYDRGRLESHGKFIEDDIDSGNLALKRFEDVLAKSSRTYDPARLFVTGNHEDRLTRHISANPELAKSFPIKEKLHLDRYNWMVAPFLKPIKLGGVTFVHYCALNAQGQVSVSKHGCNAEQQGRRMMRSTVSGHRQGIDIKYVHTPGRIISSVVAGSFYQHSEKYLTHQGDTYWRGVVVLNDVRPNGEFDPMPVSLNYLRRKYS